MTAEIREGGVIPVTLRKRRFMRYKVPLPHLGVTEYVFGVRLRGWCHQIRWMPGHRPMYVRFFWGR